MVGGEDNPITVSFVLSTQNTLTRAAEDETTWGDYDGKLGNDFENQINNSLAFPGIFKGLLQKESCD